jgi:GAF domain-containing protein
MAEQSSTYQPGGDGTPGDLSAAYAQLQSLLLEHRDVSQFLQAVVDISASVVPVTAASITLRRDRELTTVASSDDLASRVDEIQYGRGQGPCLQSLHTGGRIAVPDLAADDRWPDYRPHALEQGVGSSLSLPLNVDGTTIGALNLYSTKAGHFDGPAEQRADAFARQATTALTVAIRQREQLTLQEQLREALASRAVIDQAIGMISGQQRCTAEQAFGVLRAASQQRNIKLSIIAAEVIETISGHPYRPPRPFTDPR